MSDPIFEELCRPVAIYRIIFELNPFKFKFELGIHKLHFKKNGGNTYRYPECVGPENPSQNWILHPPSTHGRHREFDLELK
jgi:hypothetical protein